MQVQEPGTGYRDCRVGSLVALVALPTELNVIYAAARLNVTPAPEQAEQVHSEPSS